MPLQSERGVSLAHSRPGQGPGLRSEEGSRITYTPF